jgi:hypothetical protein
VFFIIISEYFESSATINNATFTEELTDVESPQFQQLAREFCEAVGDPHSYCFIIIIYIDLMSEEELFVYIMD